MTIKIKVQGFKQVERLLKRTTSKLGRGTPSVLVGYGGETVVNSTNKPYAVYVHEDLEAHHDIGQAKFLEEAPFTSDELAEIVSDSLKQGSTLMAGLEKAGHLVLERSEPLVPVDTGNLVSSGFVRREV